MTKLENRGFFSCGFGQARCVWLKRRVKPAAYGIKNLWAGLRRFSQDKGIA